MNQLRNIRINILGAGSEKERLELFQVNQELMYAVPQANFITSNLVHACMQVEKRLRELDLAVHRPH